jgi:glutaredoxin
MAEKILFSLENCPKCIQVKDLIKDINDIKIVTYPHFIDKWTKEDLDEAKNHNVFDDLQITAPILWIDGKKFIGYLRIRKWLQDNKYI